MRTLIAWALVRFVFLAVLDLIFIHDMETSMTLFGAFTLIHVMRELDATSERKLRAEEIHNEAIRRAGEQNSRHVRRGRQSK